MKDECQCGHSCLEANDPRFEELSKYIKSLGETTGIAMSVLQQAQHLFGYLPLEVLKFISKEIHVPVAELYGVATFYSQFNLTPKGKHQIGVCLGTACYVRGAQKVLDKLREQLKVEVGGTTADGRFTLDATRCLGCCGLAPIMMIDGEVYGKLEDVSVIPDILKKYE